MLWESTMPICSKPIASAVEHACLNSSKLFGVKLIPKRGINFLSLVPFTFQQQAFFNKICVLNGELMGAQKTCGVIPTNSPITHAQDRQSSNFRINLPKLAPCHALRQNPS